MYQAIVMRQKIESDQEMQEIADSLTGKPVLNNYDDKKVIGIVKSAAFKDGFITATFDCEEAVTGLYAGPGYRTGETFESLCLGIFAVHTDNVPPIEKIPTTEQLQQRIDQLEAAIREMNKLCKDYEGTDLLQFCMGLTHDQHNEYYEIIKSIIRPE